MTKQKIFKQIQDLNILIARAEEAYMDDTGNELQYAYLMDLYEQHSRLQGILASG